MDLVVAVYSLLLFVLYEASFGGSRSIRPIDLERNFYNEISYLLQERAARQDEVIYPQPIQDPGWPDVDLNLGQVTGVSVKQDGNVVIFHRGANVWDYDSFNETDHYQQIDKGPIQNDTILTLDKDTGKILHGWGKARFYLPHGLTVDKDGNTWVTDVALHQVFKFPANSEVPAITLGEAFTPGSDKTHFCKPTDVAVATSGDFFVTDGYCNTRVLKYSADGKLIAEWGYSNGHADFLIPHGVALVEDRDLVCIADRENKRVACYTAGLASLAPGKYMFQVHDRHQRRIFGVASHGNTLFAVTGATSGALPTGLTIDLNSQKVETTWKPMEGFENPHDLAVSPNGNDLYVVEIGPNRVTKFKVGISNL